VIDAGVNVSASSVGVSAVIVSEVIHGSAPIFGSVFELLKA
jgi:hypothetical protein